MIALTQNPPVKGQIIKGIGSSGHGSPLGTSAGTTYNADFELDKLTCYSDQGRSIKFSGIDCDSLIAFYENPSSVLQKSAISIEIFPTPFASVLNVKFPSTENYELLLYDISGALVAKLKGGEEAYDLSYLKSGTYLLRITIQNHIYKTFKIQKL